jgi:hypothetical protein
MSKRINMKQYTFAQIAEALALIDASPDVTAALAEQLGISKQEGIAAVALLRRPTPHMKSRRPMCLVPNDSNTP